VAVAVAAGTVCGQEVGPGPDIRGRLTEPRGPAEYVQMWLHVCSSGVGFALALVMLCGCEGLCQPHHLAQVCGTVVREGSARPLSTAARAAVRVLHACARQCWAQLPMSCKGGGCSPVEEQLELHLWVLAVMLFSELWL